MVHFIMHLIIHKKGLHSPRILEFRGININENRANIETFPCHFKVPTIIEVQIEAQPG